MSTSRNRVIQSLLGLALLSAIASCGTPEGGTTASNLPERELLASNIPVASEDVDLNLLSNSTHIYLNYRNRQLIDNQGVGFGTRLDMTERMASRINTDNHHLRTLREKLASLGERYTKADTNVQILSANIAGDTLTARVEETSRLYYAKVHGDEPDFTAFRVERELRFVRRNNGWVLDDAQLANPDGVAPINELVETTSADPISKPEISPSEIAHVTPSGRVGNNLIGDIMFLVNRSGMVNYARTYALRYNATYRTFGNDCTNFVSQAALAGGWGMITGYYTNDDVWWYTSGFLGHQSYTWAGAQNWLQFAVNRSHRTTILASVWHMQPADVMQMDFDRDNNINHSMIVTKVGAGDIYLSYHTTDTLDRSLKSIIASYPTAWYYSHSM